MKISHQYTQTHFYFSREIILNKMIFLLFLFFCPFSFTQDLALTPHYESCKKENTMELQSQLQETKESQLKNIKSSKQKEGSDFCISCLFNLSNKEKNLQEIQRALQTKDFKEKLRKRVMGQIESKIYQMKMLRSCVESDKNWFKQKGISDPDDRIKRFCKKSVEKLQLSIKNRWSKMRLHLALSSSHLNEPKNAEFRPRDPTPRFFTDTDTWINSSPSHFIKKFTSIPKLSHQEKKQAEKHYVETLSKTPLDLLTPKDFIEKWVENPEQKIEINKITLKDRDKLKQAIKKLRKESRANYDQIMTEMPLLGYLKTGIPKSHELNQALLKMEGDLKAFKDNFKNPKVKMELLLSFDSLVEGLLKENKDYCLVAELARIKSEKLERKKNYQLLGLTLLAAIPCFSSGPVGAGACLTFGIGLGATNLKIAHKASSISYGKVLTGKDYETIAGLNEKEKSAFLEKVFIPLGLFGSISAMGRMIVVQKINFNKIETLLPSDIKKLPPKRITFIFKNNPGHKFTDEQLKVLGTNQIKAIGPGAIAKLPIHKFTPKQIIALMPEQTKVLTSKQLRTLSSQQIKFIKTPSIKHLSIHKLKLKQLKALTLEQIKALTPKQLKKFSPEQLRGLNIEQIEALTPAQRQILNTLQLEAIKSLSKGGITPL